MVTAWDCIKFSIPLIIVCVVLVAVIDLLSLIESPSEKAHREAREQAEIVNQKWNEIISSHSDNEEMNDIRDYIIHLEGRLKQLESGH